ncbi:MAG: translation initiation factor IF-3 [Actinomycetota bacterium]
MNEKIRAREVRVIGPNGDQLGIRPIPEALSLARELELDLVEVADKANPPVVRIMDYGKYKYEAAQRAKESRKKASNVVVKEMKYRPKIGSGDFDTKTRKVEKFLQEGHKVKITIMFRGREVSHPELGRRILDDIAERVEDYAKVEVYPRLDGRNMTMVLGPDGKKGKAKPRSDANRGGEQAAAEPAPAAAPAEQPAPVAAEATEADPT